MIISSLFRLKSDLVKVPQGDALFREGDVSDRMYVLVSGTADISIGRRVVEHAATGAVVGELSIIDPGPRSATVTATTECEFAQIDPEDFRYLIADNPHFAMDVMKVMARRLRQTNSMLGH